jgi:hypothetical protein
MFCYDSVTEQLLVLKYLCFVILNLLYQVNARSVFDKAMAECDELKWSHCPTAKHSSYITHRDIVARSICTISYVHNVVSAVAGIICEDCSNEARPRRC